MRKPQIGSGKADEFRQLTAREAVERMHHHCGVVEHTSGERLTQTRQRPAKARRNVLETIPEHLF